MARTFEELASEELDALYQGALFLSGGSASGAERLLVEAVTLAFEERAREADPDSVRRWLEARLVRSFLRHVTESPRPLPPETVQRVTLDPETFEEIGSEGLFRAAAALPPLPRAALWLVLLRRWGYEEAARSLGVGRDVLITALGYRHVLLREIMASRQTRRRQTRTGRG